MNMKINLIRTIFASLVLAILLRVGLGIPVITTFIALLIIYVTHLVMTEMKSGMTTTWGWMKSLGNVAMGLVVFLAIRFLAAKALGLYPIETYGAIDAAGGLRWILPGHDISTVILWEICFAMVAGQITVMWAKGTHRMPVATIIVMSLVILTLRIAYPKYVDSWATRDEVSNTLIDHGVVGSSARGLYIFLFGRPTPPAPEPTGRPAASHKPPITKQQRTPYMFSNYSDGVIPVKIKDGEVDFYPKGGEIEITTSSGEKVRDSPGTIKPRRHFPSGEYKIIKINPNAEGVEIWN